MELRTATDTHWRAGGRAEGTWAEKPCELQSSGEGKASVVNISLMNPQNQYAKAPFQDHTPYDKATRDSLNWTSQG